MSRVGHHAARARAEKHPEPGRSEQDVIDLARRVTELEGALRLVLPSAELWAEGESRTSPLHDEIDRARAVLEGE